MTKSDDGTNPKDRSGHDDGLSDEDVRRALEGYEQDFADMGLGIGPDTEESGTQESGTQENGPKNGRSADGPVPDTGTDGRHDDLPDDLPDDPTAGGGSALDESFDDQLQGILGNKARQALLVTNLSEPGLLAAFCVMAGIDATCIGASTGAVALLHDTADQGPEEAARRLTTLVTSLSVVLVVNRADRLEAHVWLDGKQGEKIAPPLLFMQVDTVVEDLVISQATPDTLREDGRTVVETSSMDRHQAWTTITRFLRSN